MSVAISYPELWCSDCHVCLRRQVASLLAMTMSRMTAREKLLQYLSTYKDVIIPAPTLTNIGFTPFDVSRGVLQDPEVLELITAAFLETADFSAYDCFAALPISGISITTALALATKKPFVIVREEVKRAGRPQIMGGNNFLKAGSRVCMVDDWIASGLNKQGALKLLDEAGAKVDMIACLGDFDMDENERGYVRELRARGIGIVTLLTWTELLDAQYNAGTMDKELYEMSMLRLQTGSFADDSKGNLTRSANYLRKLGIKLNPQVKEFLKEKGVEVSGL